MLFFNLHQVIRTYIYIMAFTQLLNVFLCSIHLCSRNFQRLHFCQMLPHFTIVFSTAIQLLRNVHLFLPCWIPKLALQHLILIHCLHKSELHHILSLWFALFLSFPLSRLKSSLSLKALAFHGWIYPTPVALSSHRVLKPDPISSGRIDSVSRNDFVLILIIELSPISKRSFGSTFCFGMQSKELLLMKRRDVLGWFF